MTRPPMIAVLDKSSAKDTGHSRLVRAVLHAPAFGVSTCIPTEFCGCSRRNLLHIRLNISQGERWDLVIFSSASVPSHLLDQVHFTGLGSALQAAQMTTGADASRGQLCLSWSLVFFILIPSWHESDISRCSPTGSWLSVTLSHKWLQNKRIRRFLVSPRNIHVCCQPCVWRVAVVLWNVRLHDTTCVLLSTNWEPRCSFELLKFKRH